MSPLLIIAGLFAGSQIPQPGSTLSIVDAVNIADKNAFAILIQQSVIEKQRQVVKQDQGKLGPTVSAGANYTRYDQATSSTFGNTSFQTQPIYTSSSNLSVSLPLDITGNTKRVVSSAKDNLAAQKATLAATKSNIRQTVRRAYIEILRAQDSVKVQQEAVANEKERVRTTQLQFDQGTVAKVDLLKAQTQLAQSSTNLITAQNTFTQAKQTLNDDLARPIETDFTVVAVTELPNPSTDSDLLTKQAQKQRAEVLALQKNQDSLRQLRKSYEQGNLPSLSVSLAVQQALSTPGFGSRYQSVNGQLALNWPLYDSGQTRAIVKQARQDEEQNRINLNEQILTVSFQVRQAITALVNARASLKYANESVNEAKEGLRLAVLKQKAGQGIFLEVLDAQNTLTTSENQQVSALYDFLEAVADLQKAYGSDKLPAGLPDDAIPIPASLTINGNTPASTGQGMK